MHCSCSVYTELMSATCQSLSSSPYTLAIIGFGRFGSFWAQVLSHSSRVDKILVYDERPRILDTQEYNTTIEIVEREALIHAHIIFFCVPISQLQISARTILPYIHERALICDTCSVKKYPIKILQELCHKHDTVIGLHPLFGPDSLSTSPYASTRTSKDTISQKGRVIMCPVRVQNNAKQQLYALFQDISLEVVEMTAEDHDRQAVYTQGITHLLGRVLEQLSLSSHIVTTRGFESLLEIMNQTCNDSQDLFYDIQRYNDDSDEMYEKLTQALNRVIQSIRNIQ